LFVFESNFISSSAKLLESVLPKVSSNYDTGSSEHINNSTTIPIPDYTSNKPLKSSWKRKTSTSLNASNSIPNSTRASTQYSPTTNLTPISIGALTLSNVGQLSQSSIEGQVKAMDTNKHPVQNPVTISEANNCTLHTQTQIEPLSNQLQDDSTVCPTTPAPPLERSLDQLISDIYHFLSTSAAPVPNSSTVPIPHASADLLYDLDQISNDIVQRILTFEKETADVTCSPLALQDFQRTIYLPRHVGVAELQRCKARFVKINTQHPPSSTLAIGTAFVDFLMLQL